MKPNVHTTYNSFGEIALIQRMRPEDRLAIKFRDFSPPALPNRFIIDCSAGHN